MTQTSLPITVCTYVPRWDLTEWIMLEGEAKFELGMISVSQWALKELTEQTIRTALLRHAHGDWGDIDSAYPEMHSPKPSAVNDRAVTECGEIMSLYDCDGNPFYIFTEGTGCNTRIFMLLEM